MNTLMRTAEDYRAHNALTMGNLALDLDVSTTTYSHWLSGRSVPSVYNAIKLMTAAGYLWPGACEDNARDFIRDWKKARDLTTTHAAKIIGCSRMALVQWLNAEVGTTYDRLEKMSKITNTPIEEILEYEVQAVKASS